MNTCPHCGAGVLIMDNGKECRAASGAWVTFACLTSIHDGRDTRMSQSRRCEEAERDVLIAEVAALRTANKSLVERIKRLEGAGERMYVLLDPASICMRTTEMDNALQGWDDAKISTTKTNEQHYEH